MRAGRAHWAAAALLGLAGVAVSSAGREPAPALINESRSLPRGLYVLRPGSAPEPGAVVAATPPAAAEPYLAGLGRPHGLLLLKRVAAAHGDRVCRRGDRVRAGGRTVRAPAHDGRGAPLPVWSGCRRLEADELFLLGDTADSFDSRYFGPVAASSVTGVYREGLTW